MAESPKRARGYSWPPAEPGNTLAVKSGAWSDRMVSAKADELEPMFQQWISEHAPWAAAPEFELARANYLQHLALVRMLSEDIAATAAQGGTSTVPTRRFETLLSALRGELAALGQLGLTPPSKSQLAQTVATTRVSLAELAERGEALIPGTIVPDPEELTS